MTNRPICSCSECDHFRHGTLGTHHQCHLLNVSCSFARQTYDPYGCGREGRRFEDTRNRQLAVYSMGMQSFLAQSAHTAVETERMAQVAITEYRAKGFTVTRIWDEIIVEGTPDDV